MCTPLTYQGVSKYICEIEATIHILCAMPHHIDECDADI